MADANWFIPFVCAVTLVLLVKRTATEEAKLLERFGDDYRRYMQNTGRFFPNLKGHASCLWGRQRWGKEDKPRTECLVILARSGKLQIWKTAA
ncbi:MAG: methyltransferase family protein [Gemmataceae bacterium]